MHKSIREEFFSDVWIEKDVILQSTEGIIDDVRKLKGCSQYIDAIV